MQRVRIRQEEMEEKEERRPDDASMLPAYSAGRPWQEIPRNATLTKTETLAFFSEFKRAGELPDTEVIERCIFLMRHAPPQGYLGLKVKSKFVQLIKRLEKVDLREHCLSRDDCLQPSGVVWKTGEDIETAGRDCFPEDVMTCTIANDLFKLWPVLSFMQGIGTLYQVDGRAIDLGRKIMHLLDELAKKYPLLAKLLDPPTVIFTLQAMNVDPAAVVIPAGLAPGHVPGFPGAVGIWTCPSELRVGELIGHLRATLATLLPGVVPHVCMSRPRTFHNVYVALKAKYYGDAGFAKVYVKVDMLVKIMRELRAAFEDDEKRRYAMQVRALEKMQKVVRDRTPPRK